MNRNKVNPRATERLHGYGIAGGDHIDHLPFRLLERTGSYPGTKPSPDDADPHLPGAGPMLSLALIHRQPQQDRKQCVSTSMLPFWSSASLECTADLIVDVHPEAGQFENAGLTWTFDRTVQRQLAWAYVDSLARHLERVRGTRPEVSGLPPGC